MIEFGESFRYLKLGSAGKRKANTRWETGIFLGVRDKSTEMFIGTSEEVVKDRTVKGKGSLEERWNAVQVDELQGSPWEPQPGRQNFDVEAKHIHLQDREDRGIELLEGVHKPDIKHRFPVALEDIEEQKTFGKLPGICKHDARQISKEAHT